MEYQSSMTVNMAMWLKGKMARVEEITVHQSSREWIMKAVLICEAYAMKDVDEFIQKVHL